MTRYQSDVVIVGGGIAGIVTALELLDAGKSVTLIDRDVEANFGGLAVEAFGGMFFVDTPLQRKAGIADSPEIAFRDWCTFGELPGGDDLPSRWAKRFVERTTPDVYDWVSARGIGFLPVVGWPERGMYRPGNSFPRFHIVWGTGRELVKQLTDALRDHLNQSKLTLAFSHKVDGLEYSAGRVTGCAGTDETSGASFRAEAEVVVIAAGGMNGSDERVRAHWHGDWGAKPPTTILNGSHQFADGTLHDAAQAIGGRVINHTNNWNYAAGITHPRPGKPRHGLSLIPSKSALWMDARGRRIGPEPLVSGYDTRELIVKVCAAAQGNPDAAYSWQILNRKIMLKEFAISGAESNATIRDKNKIGLVKNLIFGNSDLVDSTIADNPDVVTADTVAQLVAKMNDLGGPIDIDGAGMEADIAAYDAMINRGPRYFNDDQLRRIAHLRQYKGDRVRTCKFQRIVDPKAGPLVAIRTFIISRKSLGGIETDLDSRVLNAEGVPIDGLYAVGEGAGFGGGGVHGLRALEGTFLGGCIFSARMAAKAIITGTSLV